MGSASGRDNDALEYLNSTSEKPLASEEKSATAHLVRLLAELSKTHVLAAIIVTAICRTLSGAR